MTATVYHEKILRIKGDPAESTTRKLCVPVGDRRVHLVAKDSADMHYVAPREFSNIRRVKLSRCTRHHNRETMELTGDTKVAVEATAPRHTRPNRT